MTWLKYKKKPIIIYATPLTCDKYVTTLEGKMFGKKGDFLIQGIEGEYYVCKKSVFEKTYELVK